MISYSSILPNAPVALLARVEDDTGTLLTPSTVSSISAVVTNVMTDVAASAITLSTSSIYSTLQLSDQWTADGIGFNAAFQFAGSNFSDSGSIYQIIVTISTTSGSTIPLAWQLQTDETF